MTDLAVDIGQLAIGVKAGDRRAIAQAITLAESRHLRDRARSVALLQQLGMEKPETLRIGITGSPGVGKSTLINSLGQEALGRMSGGLAVITVDPSSPLTKGSILGDKTRMLDLAQNNRVFIRPSPASGHLGGAALKTREVVTILEASRFDTIMIETVGVGQSEHEISTIADVVLLLHMPGTGDDLQGIKKGVLEFADLIVVNKADGPFLTTAQSTKQVLQNALGSRSESKRPSVICCSAETRLNIPELWSSIVGIVQTRKESGSFEARRRMQAQAWLKQAFQAELCRLAERWFEEAGEFKSAMACAGVDRAVPSATAYELARKVVDPG